MQTKRARKRAVVVTVALAWAAIAVWLSSPLPSVSAAYPAPLVVPASRGAACADTYDASRAGAEVLAHGGNAVDAAVATALALGVAAPGGSGLGGGGFAVVWLAKEKRARVIDFRETAPRKASRDMFIVDGKAVAEKSRWGGLAVAVPGEPMGLDELERAHGKLGLARAAEPAIRLARDGFVVSPHLAEAIARIFGRLGSHAGADLRALFAPDGKPLDAGARLRRADLARTLERFAKDGAPGFYNGPVARAMVAAVKAHGGLLTDEDLTAYKARWEEPLEGHYRGYLLIGVPPPAGGATAIEALQVLDARPPLAPLGAGSSAADHAIAEALKHAFADRARALGDPAFVDVPTRKLVDPAYARELAARVADDRVQKPEAYGGKTLSGVDVPHDHGTSHLCVADGEGNVVALTTTINLGFGAAFVGGESGVLMNDEMDDFSAQPGVPNAYGLIGGFANAVAPGKRPLSSMTPLIALKDGAPALCAGGSGGPLIVSETVQTVVNVIDFGLDAQAAVAAPRIHAQWVPDVLLIEPEIPNDVIEGLKKRGHKIIPPPPFAGSAAQAIVFKDGKLQAASDPRKGGAPAAP